MAEKFIYYTDYNECSKDDKQCGVKKPLPPTGWTTSGNIASKITYRDHKSNKDSIKDKVQKNADLLNDGQNKCYYKNDNIYIKEGDQNNSQNMVLACNEPYVGTIYAGGNKHIKKQTKKKAAKYKGGRKYKNTRKKYKMKKKKNRRTR